MKRTLILLFIIFSVFMFSSCGIVTKLILSENTIDEIPMSEVPQEQDTQQDSDTQSTPQSELTQETENGKITLEEFAQKAQSDFDALGMAPEEMGNTVEIIARDGSLVYIYTMINEAAPSDMEELKQAIENLMDENDEVHAAAFVQVLESVDEVKSLIIEYYTVDNELITSREYLEQSENNGLTAEKYAELLQTQLELEGFASELISADVTHRDNSVVYVFTALIDVPFGLPDNFIKDEIDSYVTEYEKTNLLRLEDFIKNVPDAESLIIECYTKDGELFATYEYTENDLQD